MGQNRRALAQIWVTVGSKHHCFNMLQDVASILLWSTKSDAYQQRKQTWRQTIGSPTASGLLGMLPKHGIPLLAIFALHPFTNNFEWLKPKMRKNWWLNDKVLKLSILWTHWCHMFEPSSIDKGSYCEGWPPLLARSKYGMGTSAHRKGDSKAGAGAHGPIHWQPNEHLAHRLVVIHWA